MASTTLMFCVICILWGVAAAQQCPAVPPGTGGICVEMCSDDDDCRQWEKCCSNGCGHTCQTAVEPLCPPVCALQCEEGLVLKEDKNGCKLCRCVHPCENERCPPGTVCELQEVTCVTTPCYPVPECVPQVPATPQTCPPVCAMECTDGQVMKEDENGCKLCECVDLCENKQCPLGTECRLREVQCIRAPCYPQPVCLPEY